MVVRTLRNKGVPMKHIMAYTGHKSGGSLIHYDDINHQEGTEISNILLQGRASCSQHEDPGMTLLLL